MIDFAEIGNDLYSGKRSINFVRRLRQWLVISAVLLGLAIGGLGLRGLNLGIEFTGGSDFRIPDVQVLDDYESRARDVVRTTGEVDTAKVTLVGADDIRIETERFDAAKTQAVSTALGQEFNVPAQNVASSVVGPSWGASVSRKALQALVWFLILVSIVLALYFRTWKMSFAALVALLHDIVITVGIYSLFGLEVTPASMIGFLTILGYSLYDTVVVFDKVRENTDEASRSGRQTFAEASNLAVNQTLVRSINTTVVALLPVLALLVVGVLVLGPGTLLDLSVSLAIGITVGAYSSIFIATPIYVWLREREPAVQEADAKLERRRRHGGRRPDAAGPGGAGDADRRTNAGAGRFPVAVGSGVAGSVGTPLGQLSDELDGQTGASSPLPSATASDPDSDSADDGGTARTVSGRPLHPWVQTGPRNQPKRLPKSKR